MRDLEKAGLNKGGAQLTWQLWRRRGWPGLNILEAEMKESKPITVQFIKYLLANK